MKQYIGGTVGGIGIEALPKYYSKSVVWRYAFGGLRLRQIGLPALASPILTEERFLLLVLCPIFWTAQRVARVGESE